MHNCILELFKLSKFPFRFGSGSVDSKLQYNFEFGIRLTEVLGPETEPISVNLNLMLGLPKLHHELYAFHQ